MSESLGRRNVSAGLTAPGNEVALDALLAEPDDATVRALDSLNGDLLVLGAGGKMGPSLTRMAQLALARGVRTTPSRRVIAVSRFGDAAAMLGMQASGVETIRADLADPRAVAALPNAANVIWMAGQKFGTADDPVSTWTQNVVASVHGAERFAGARMVCFSTGNVYGQTAVSGGGSRETDALVPDGEYAASCVGRERVFESIARRTGSPLLLYRLFYACDLRYGVVTEIALKVVRREPVSLAAGYANVIWQGDANRLALRALTLAATPAVALNVTGSMVSVREIAEHIGRIAGIAPLFEGDESPHALIANTDRLAQMLPHHALPLETLCEWAVRWIRNNGRLLNKPTKFEVRDGRF